MKLQIHETILPFGKRNKRIICRKVIRRIRGNRSPNEALTLPLRLTNQPSRLLRLPPPFPLPKHIHTHTYTLTQPLKSNLKRGGTVFCRVDENRARDATQSSTASGQSWSVPSGSGPGQGGAGRTRSFLPM